MAIYKYKAKNMESKIIEGKHEANDKHELAAFLRSQNLFLMNYKLVGEQEKNTTKIKLNELADFARQLSVMLGSGVSLTRAIAIMMRRKRKPKIQQAYENIYRMLQQGNTLSDAMEAQGKAFPPIMINMFRAGESSGQLDRAAARVAVQFAKDYRIQNKIKSASMYPIILIIATAVVVFALFKFILPNFFELFASVELPLITQIMMGISVAFNDYWMFIIIGILILIACIGAAISVPSIRLKLDKKKITLFKIGPLLRIIYTARFARSLCSLYNSGITIVSALQIVRENINNKYIEGQFDHLTREVRNGIPLSVAIKEVDGFDEKLSSHIFIGEESGKLEDMLESIADEFDYESEEATQRLVTVLEPVLIVLMAIIIGVVMISVMLPIFDLYKNSGSFA